MRKSIDRHIFTNVEKDIPFSFEKNSTIGCGGYASVGYYPKTEEEVINVINACDEDKRAYAVVGNLSNVLPSDEYNHLCVVSTKKYSFIKPKSKNIFVSAGCSVGKLLAYCKANGLSGAEFLTGIPCSIGGATYMNAGVAGAYMSDIIQSVRVYGQGNVYTLSVNDCQFGYKNSIFMDNNSVILGVELALKNAMLFDIEEKLRVYSDRRKHLPKGKSMGCVFKNPNGEYAGKWIEKAGLKGLRCGGAIISNEHANFIINDGGATAQNVKDLIKIIKNAVFSQYGVQLEEEIRYL